MNKKKVSTLASYLLYGLLCIVVLMLVVWFVAEIPDRYASALATTGSLALLGVTAIYVSHTRRQVDLMSRTYKAQVSAPRLASMRKFAAHVPEWSREHLGLLANVGLVTSIVSMTGAVTFSTSKRVIDESLGRVDAQVHATIIEQIERMNVDLPDEVAQIAKHAAKAAHQDAIWVALFVANIQQELASPDSSGRSNERLAEQWAAMTSELKIALPTWESLNAPPIKTELSAALVDLQEALSEAFIAAREDI